MSQATVLVKNEWSERNRPLTQREKQVTFWVVEGKTYAEIAQILGITKKTVNDHISHVHQKLGIYEKASLVRWAFKTGFVDCPVDEIKADIRLKTVDVDKLIERITKIVTDTFKGARNDE